MPTQPRSSSVPKPRPRISRRRAQSTRPQRPKSIVQETPKERQVAFVENVKPRNFTIKNNTNKLMNVVLGGDSSLLKTGSSVKFEVSHTTSFKLEIKNEKYSLTTHNLQIKTRVDPDTKQMMLKTRETKVDLNDEIMGEPSEWSEWVKNDIEYVVGAEDIMEQMDHLIDFLLQK